MCEGPRVAAACARGPVRVGADGHGAAPDESHLLRRADLSGRRPQPPAICIAPRCATTAAWNTGGCSAPRASIQQGTERLPRTCCRSCIRVAGVSDAAAFRLQQPRRRPVRAGDDRPGRPAVQRRAHRGVGGGIVLALLPMQLHWSRHRCRRTGGSAAVLRRSMVAAVHFARVRTSVGARVDDRRDRHSRSTRGRVRLIVPVIALTLVAARATRIPDAASGGSARRAALVASSLAVLHILAVSNEGWGTTGPQLSWQHAVANFSHQLLLLFPG